MQFIRRHGTSGMGGQLCEIKLSMFVLLDGMIRKDKNDIKNFYIASNKEEAGDFDDIVYKYDYEENGRLKTRIIFLQVIYIEKSTKISKHNLLSTSNSGNFILRKYLSSYWKIEQQFKTNRQPIFSNKIDDCDLILYTNAQYFFEQNNDILIEKEISKEDILHFKRRYFYKLNASQEQVLNSLKIPIDFNILVKELARTILKNYPSIDFRKIIIRDFQYPLTQKVLERINQDEMKLRENFLNGDPDPEFTSSFLQEIKKDARYQNEADDTIKNSLRNIKIKIHPSFLDNKSFPLRVSLPPKEFSNDDIKKFADKFKIFSDQLSGEELANEFKRRIKETYKVRDQDIEPVYLEIQNKVLEWWQNNHYFLTETNTIIHEAIRMYVRFEISEPTIPWVERDKELEDLRNINCQSETVVVTGPGGVGKSELVRKYISDHAEDYDNNLIWVDADSYLMLEKSFFTLAQKLKIKTEDEEKIERDLFVVIEEIYEYFAVRKRKSLFVFDNAGKYKSIVNTDEGLDKFLPKGPNKPSVIITSRNESWSENICEIQLKAFEEEKAIEYITKALDDSESEITEDMKKLAKTLEYLPLALKHSVAYIREENDRIQKLSSDKFKIKNYLSKYEKFVKNSLNLKLDIYTKTIFTTCSVTMDQITKRPFGKEAEEIIHVLAYVLPNNIPVRGLFTNLIMDIETLSDAAKLLNQYSMANLSSGMFNIHRVVQDVIRIQLQQKGKENSVLQQCWALSKIHNNDPQDKAGGLNPIDGVTAQLFALKYQKAYLQSRKEILTRQDQFHKKENYDTLISKYIIGVEHQKSGRFNDALRIFREILKNFRLMFQEEDHKDILMVKNSIAMVLKDLGQYDEALQYYEEVLSNRKQILGDDHPETLLSLFEMGLVYEQQEKFTKALEIYKEVLEKQKPKLPNDYPGLDILGIENNIAGIWLELGECKMALELHQKIYEKRIEVVGENHPDTLQSLHNIGLSYEYLGDEDRALKTYQSVLTKKKEILGEDHVDTLRTFS